MTIAYRLDGALLPFQSVRLQGNDGTANGFPSFATMGEPGIAQVRIEDPSGVLDIDGWHTFTVEESACSKPRIFSGWILGRTITRGPYRTGAGRIWQCEIIDQNALFGFEVFRSTAASVRPAETDVARITAAMASHAMAGTPIYNNGRFSTANPLSLAAGNFVAQTPAEMFGSTAGQCAKNFYAYWDDSARQISLHYDAVGSGPAAGISISNVATDVTSGSGGTVYPPLIDAELNKDPTPLYTGVLLHWTGGYVYDRNSTVIDDLSPSEFSPTNFLRDLSIDSDRIGKASTAASQLAKQLSIHSVESESLTCTVQVAAAHVNLCNAGDVINVRFSHIPGYTTSTAVAITRRTVEPVDGMDSLYNVTLELANTGVARGAGGGGVGGLPLPQCTATFVQEAESVDTSSNLQGSGIALPSIPVPGNLLVAWVVLRDISGSPQQTLVPTGFTAVGTKWQEDPASGGGHKDMGCRFFYRFVVSGDTNQIALTRTGSSNFAYVHVSEWNGVDQFDGLLTLTNDEDVSGSPRFYSTPPVTPLANRSALMVAGFMPSLNINDAWHAHATGLTIALGGSGFGDSGGGADASAKNWLGYQAGPKASGLTPSTFIITDPDPSGVTRGYAGLVVTFSGECTDTPPAPGQPVNNEPPPTVGGGATTFTTDNPYADGSLKVFVDGIRQYVIETDPGTGAYQLLFDPRPSEYVVVDYQARTGTE